MIIVRQVPLYWGIETDAVDHSFATRATLHEVLPPFRHSIWAFRIRVSHKHWLHVGKFVYEREARRWGMDTDVEEISQWRGPHVVEDEEDDRVPTAPI
jgi:hypothetical protein